GANCVVAGPPTVPNAKGVWGSDVPVRAPGATSVASGEDAARAFIAQRMPPELVQQVAYNKGGSGGLMQTGGPAMPPPGMPIAPDMAAAGAAGGSPPPPMPPNAAVAAVGALTGNYAGQFAAARTSVRFLEPRGMKVSWMIGSADGKRWNPQPLEAPA